MYRSAAALTSLIRTSARSMFRVGSFFYAVSEIEPVFHLETLAEALGDANPEKKIFQSLAKLGRLFNIFADKQDGPTWDIVSETRMRLNALLAEYRFAFFIPSIRVQ